MYLRMDNVRDQLFEVIQETFFLSSSYKPSDYVNSYASGRCKVDGVSMSDYEWAVYNKFRSTLNFGTCSVFCNNEHRAILWRILPNKQIDMALLCTRCCQAILPPYNDPNIRPEIYRECMIMKRPSVFQTHINVDSLFSCAGMYNVYVYFNFVVFY